MIIDGDIRYWLQIAVLVALALAAWRWGAGPERALAGLLVGMSIFDAANHALFEVSSSFMTVDAGHVLIDLAALAASLAVAINANRMYPLWFAAFQLIAVFAHIARGLADETAGLAYQIMFIGPSYCQIIIMALAIRSHRRRVRQNGPYRSWRTFWDHSQARAPTNWPNG